MSHVIAICEQTDSKGIDRSQFRLPTYTDEPVTLLFNLNGSEIAPIVDRLDVGQARFVWPEQFESFYEGQMLGPAVLDLKAEGMVVVDPVVTSKNWPMVEVEFIQISEVDRQVVNRFLVTCSGGSRPPIKGRTRTASYSF